MKRSIQPLFLIFFISLSIIFTKADDPPANNIASCEGDCKVKLKVKGIFPLRGEERHLNSPLNRFDWKWFYLYSDHMSIFRASQKPPEKSQNESPAQTDFLNNFPMESFYSPCNNFREICSVGDFRDQVLKPMGVTFAPNEEVIEGFGEKEAFEKCLILAQDLQDDPHNMFYACAHNLDDLQKLRTALSDVLSKTEKSESVGRIFMLNNEQNDLVEMNMHLNNELMVGNNAEEKIEDGVKNPNYKEFFRYGLVKDIKGSPVALKKIDAEIPWKGEAEKKPERDRCFYNLIKDPNGGVKKVYYCIFSSKDGRTPYNVEKAALAANEWVMKSSVNVNRAKLEADQKVIVKMTDSIDPNSKELKAIKEAVFNFAVQYDKDAEAKIKSNTPGATQEKFDKEKIPAITEKIKELCLS